jgi:transcriptional regulator with XRE-family HTH domain
MTLGEMLAVTSAMALLCKQDKVSVAEIADITGLRKQNISRWMNKRVGDSVRLEVNDRDERVRDVSMVDPGRAQAHLESLACILGTDLDQLRDKDRC